MNCCFVVKAPAQMPSWSTNNTNLDKKKFDMFYYLIDRCATIYVQIWMNNLVNLPNESKIIMLSIIHWNQFCCIFLIEIWSQTRVSSFFLTHAYYTVAIMHGMHAISLLIVQAAFAIQNTCILYILLFLDSLRIIHSHSHYSRKQYHNISLA